MAAALQVGVIIVYTISEIIHVFQFELDVLAEIYMCVEGVGQRNRISLVAHHRITMRHYMFRVISIKGEDLHEVEIVSQG